MFSLISGISYTAQMSLSTEKEQTHGLGEQTCGAKGGRGREWEGRGVWGS